MPVRTALRGAVAVVMALTLAGAAAAAERPLRLGLYHPRPRLCRVDEPSQRDLRVLRLAFSLAGPPAGRLDWPWFYRAQPEPPPHPRQVLLSLDRQALWGRPALGLDGRSAVPAGDGADPLAAWQAWVLARLPQARPAEPGQAAAGARFVLPSPAAAPLLPSRLAGSRLLPFTRQAEPADAARADSTLPAPAAGDAPPPAAVAPAPPAEPSPADAGPGAPDCRDWPADVTVEPPSDTLRYGMRIGRGPGGVPLHLLAYRDEDALWRAYFRGRLDALLLEAGDLDGQLGRYRASQLGDWGLLPGTQQIVLRIHPRLAEALGMDGRTALSLALPRSRLAQVDGPGRFLAATDFLGPLHALGAGQPAQALAWDTLHARRLWLDHPHALPEIRFAVLDHPMLEHLADRMQAQWSKTLNLTVHLQRLPVDQFYRALDAGEAELSLDVLDLDDGSLQDFWLQALRRLHAPLYGPPARWEAAFRAGLPYVPLLGNVHNVLLRRDAPPGLLQRVCPGCTPAVSPRRLAPEPRERENPQG